MEYYNKSEKLHVQKNGVIAVKAYFDPRYQNPNVMNIRNFLVANLTEHKEDNTDIYDKSQKIVGLLKRSLDGKKIQEGSLDHFEGTPLWDKKDILKRIFYPAKHLESLDSSYNSDNYLGVIERNDLLKSHQHAITVVFNDDSHKQYNPGEMAEEATVAIEYAEYLKKIKAYKASGVMKKISTFFGDILKSKE